MNDFDFMRELKEATASKHVLLEKSGTSTNLMSAQVTLQNYADYLLASYRLHASVEQSAFPLARHLLSDLHLREKVAHIKNDLKELGLLSIGEPVAFFEKASANFALGALYVTEGSTLGGIYIQKHLKQHLKQPVSCTFLNVYGDKTGALWQAFTRALNEFAFSSSLSGRSEIVAGANYAFEKADLIFNNYN